MYHKGIAYPVTKHPRGFFHHSPTDLAQIKSDMAAIILTGPNERIFLPYFGVDFKSINLNAPASLVNSQIRMNVAVALKKWEKRVQVHDILIDLANDDDNLIVKITVLFIDPINISKIENLTVYKSLGGLNGRPMPF